MEERSFEAAQRFLLATKRYWTTTLYRALREEYDSHARAGGRPGTVAGVADVVEDLTLYRYFAWLERHLQRMKYSGHYGLVPYYEERRESVLRSLDAATRGNPALDLQPDLPLPEYYTRVDIHEHPGGVWGDEIAGLVYEHGARSTTPLLGASHNDLHTRLTDLIASEGPVTNMLDVGCGFGKSTRPFCAKFPEARVEAIDLSAPCLRVAAREPAGSNARYRQRDAAHTGYPDASFDLVTGTMLLHEIPPEPMKRIMEETFRVLQPGGRMVHLDFYYFPDDFARFLHYGHGRRNNEPYMQPLAEQDLPKMLQEIGFSDVQIRPFQESEGIDPHAAEAWRFPWTVISAVKPDRANGSKPT